MKYLNNYKIFENKEEIDSICELYHITNYSINDDGSIDVDGAVSLWNWNRQLARIPLKFNRIARNHQNQILALLGGWFHCNDNVLTSLEGCPKYVGGTFLCGNNNITSLEGSPKYIGNNFDFSNNKITSLEGFPEFVGGNIYCTGNPISCVIRYFIHKEDKNNLIELFNYYDIVQDMNIIYDRLKYFYEGIDEVITDNMLKDIEKSGYKIIY